MINFNLGETFEEKKVTYEALSQNAEKWGKVGRVLGWIMAIFIGLLLLTATSGNLFLILFVIAACLIATPIFYYWYCQVLYYGFLVVVAYFEQRNIGSNEVAKAVGTSFLVSYILGGKKAAKATGTAWLVLLLVAVIIGVYAGLYYFVKFYKEAYELGFEKDFKTKFLQSTKILDKITNKGFAK